MFIKVTTEAKKIIYVNSDKISHITAKTINDDVTGVVICCGEATTIHRLDEYIPLKEGMNGIERLIIALQKSNETIIDVNAYVR